MLPEKLGKLAVHLAEGGKSAEALLLARTLLPRLAAAPSAAATYELEDVLGAITPALVTSGGMQSLRLLCDLLAGTIAQPVDGMTQSSVDDSYVWRPAIEEHEQNGPVGLHASRHLLLRAVRDAATQLVREGKPLREVVDALESYQPAIFRRIALYTLQNFPDADPPLVAEHLTDEALFRQPSFRHEYALLARDGFKRLTETEQATILHWIEAGPSPRPSSANRGEGAVASSDGTDADRIDAWRRDRLAPFHEDLPSEWRARYDDMVARLGPPEHPDFIFFMTVGWVDPRSPLSADRLRTLSIEELVHFLDEWEPADDFRGPSREGLARMLTEVVQADPQRFAPDAQRFESLHPAYAAAILAGLERAAREKRPFTWKSVLALCTWCLRQPSATEETRQQSVDLPADAGARELWREARAQIAHLLFAGLDVSPDAVPFALRREVWAAVQVLADDSDPTPELEARFGGSNMSPWDLALNTVRGQALHTAVRYAWWVRHHLRLAASDSKSMEPGFNQMLEVRDLLDQHLNPMQDPSLAVRSVYGQWFPALVVLDREWAAAHVAAMFPASQDKRAYWEAAWQSFVLFNQPSRDVFDVLAGEYRRATERIGTQPDERHYPFDPDTRLGVHLFQLYWQGVIGYTDEESSLRRFFVHASDKMSGAVFDTVGHLLFNTTEEIERSFLERLQALWEWRMQSTLAEHPEAHHDELASFAWWFGSGKFGPLWAVMQLADVLRLTEGRLEAYTNVYERLAEVAPAYPRVAITCLGLLLEADVRRWLSSVWRQHIVAVFLAVRESKDAAAKEASTRLINRLAARGYIDFLAYLPS